MARYNKDVKEIKTEEVKKDELKEKGNTVLAIILSVISLAILVFIIVIVILSFKKDNGDDPEEEKVYEATYTEENTPGLVEITYDDLSAILDNDAPSNYAKPLVYVLVYSPNYELYADDDKEAEGSAESFQNAVKAAIAQTAEKNDVAFYIINVLSDDNKKGDSTVLSTNGIVYSKNGYALVEIKYNGEEQKNDIKTYTILVDVMEQLEGIAE